MAVPGRLRDQLLGGVGSVPKNNDDARPRLGKQARSRGTQAFAANAYQRPPFRRAHCRLVGNRLATLMPTEGEQFSRSSFWPSGSQCININRALTQG
jgi:hypothetical protein